jgi:hypothetical protein
LFNVPGSFRQARSNAASYRSLALDFAAPAEFSPPLANFTSPAPLFKVVFIKKFSQNDQAPRRGEIPQ